MDEQQINALKMFFSVTKPIETVLFAPGFLFGLNQLPSDVVVKTIEAQRQHAKPKIEEKPRLRMASKWSKERRAYYGLWADGF